MSNENNNNKEQNIKDKIIKEYIDAENKNEAIKELSKKYELSISYIYRILREEEIPTPSKFKNGDDINNSDKSEIEFLDDLELDSDSLVKKYKDHGFYDKPFAQRIMNLHCYAEAKIGIDIWKSFWNYMEWMIYNIEKNQLQTDISEIKKGNFGSFDTAQTLMDDFKKEMVKDLLGSYQENKPEILEQQEIEEPEPIIDENMMDLLLAINSKGTSEQKINMFRFIKQAKGEPDPLIKFQDQYLKTVKDISKINKSKNHTQARDSLAEKLNINQLKELVKFFRKIKDED